MSEMRGGSADDRTGDGTGWVELLAALAVAVAVAVTGGGLALLWRLLAPSVTVVMTAFGPVLADQHSEAFIAVDGVFGALGAGAGVVAGLAAFALRRWRGPVLLVGLVLGCLAASWICSRLGAELGRDGYEKLLDQAEAGRRIRMPVRLRAEGMLLVQPLTAAATYVVCAAWSGRSDLGMRPVSGPPAAPPVSWGSSGPGGWPAEPAPPAAGSPSSPHA